eukprot:2433193-Pleurochrysis_carterae.AAC.1
MAWPILHRRLVRVNVYSLKAYASRLPTAQKKHNREHVLASRPVCRPLVHPRRTPAHASRAPYILPAFTT